MSELRGHALGPASGGDLAGDPAFRHPPDPATGCAEPGVGVRDREDAAQR